MVALISKWPNTDRVTTHHYTYYTSKLLNLLVGRYTQADGREGIVGGTAETICALGADLRR